MPLADRLAVLRTLWILSATTTNPSAIRPVLLEAIRSSNIPPQLLVTIVNRPECQQILHAQRHITDGCWSCCYKLSPNEEIGQFLDVLKMAGEGTPGNEIRNQSNQASSSRNTLSKDDGHQNGKQGNGDDSIN